MVSVKGPSCSRCGTALTEHEDGEIDCPGCGLLVKAAPEQPPITPPKPSPPAMQPSPFEAHLAAQRQLLAELRGTRAAKQKVVDSYARDIGLLDKQIALLERSLRELGQPIKTGKSHARQWTPEQRAAQRERLARVMEAKRQQKEESD